MKLLITFFFTVIISITQAQNTNITGKLIDSVGKQVLENASVSLLDSKDSTLEQFTLAKSTGFFELKNVPLGLYVLQISFQGYDLYFKKINISKDEPYIQLGNIYLKQQAKNLGDVTVNTSPIVIKKDTIEYNAGSFKTKPNSTAEDLLKKMPGIQVDKDGNVKAHGEDVPRILVDGKRFFGDDPKMATKNLPSDVIDKIQVFDAQSDQSAFTGFDDGSRTKTINIVTRKDKRKGLFGKASVGFGTDGEDYLQDQNANLNYFNNGKQLSFTGQANNVNKQNFSVQDALGAFGGNGGGNRGGGGIMNTVQNLIGSGSSNGLVNTWSGGLNFGQDYGGKNNSLNASGFYNNQRTNKNTNSFTETFRGTNADSSIFGNAANTSTTLNKNLRLNFNLEKPLDSNNINAIVIRPNISFQNTQTNATNYTNKTNKIGDAILNSNGNSSSNNKGYNGSLDVTFRHRFVKKGRSISINTNLAGNNNDGNGNNYSLNNDLIRNKNLTTNQQYKSNSNSNTLSGTLSYTEPVGKFGQLEFAYNKNHQLSESDKQTFSYDSSTKNYETPVINSTNIFSNTYSSDRGTISYRLNKDKFNFTIGNGIQWGNLNSINKTKNTTVNQNYTNFYPTANFNYNFSKTQNLRVNYSGRTSQPSVSQLQDIVDSTNSLNIKVGNPNLDQKFTHNVRLFYHSFNIFTQKIIVAMANISVVANDIQNNVAVLPNGTQVTMPVNLNGTYNAFAYFNYGFPLRKPKSNLNFGLSFNKNQSQSLINGLSNYSRNTTFGTNIIWTTNLKEKWDINFTSNTTYNIAKYTLQPNQDANYFSQYLSTELTYYTKSGWIFSSDFDYTYNSGKANGFNTSVPLLNASISKQIFKTKAGEIKLYAFDLLKQNLSNTRTVSSIDIVDSRTQVLQQYVMLSFTYNLKKFKGQTGMPGMNKMFKGMRNGGGMSF